MVMLVVMYSYVTHECGTRSADWDGMRASFVSYQWGQIWLSLDNVDVCAGNTFHALWLPLRFWYRHRLKQESYRIKGSACVRSNPCRYDPNVAIKRYIKAAYGENCSANRAYRSFWPKLSRRISVKLSFHRCFYSIANTAQGKGDFMLFLFICC